MARYEFRMHRLHVTADLAADAPIEATREQSHYLLNVLRLAPGRPVLLFNGRDGEWRAELAEASRRTAVLRVVEQTRSQEGGPDLHYLFAPLKRARLDYMVEKATEMGVARLKPVLTRHTQAERVNLERMRANVVEAAEQCGVLRVPEVAPPMQLEQVLDRWPADRLLVFCDEDAEVASPLDALRARAGGVLEPGCPLAVVIGPEGGFSPQERDRLMSVPSVIRLSLGPRILRADTAAVAALALVNAVLGDWR